MIITLPWINPIDTNNVPSNFDELVKESFKKFTDGTSDDFTFLDKLSYLDNLRKIYLREDDTELSVRNLIRDMVLYHLEEYNEMPETDEILDVEFMERCYDEGFRPFHCEWDKTSSSKNYNVQKLILRIIQIVVNYEKEVEE